jgi:hypothetical protein
MTYKDGKLYKLKNGPDEIMLAPYGGDKIRLFTPDDSLIPARIAAKTYTDDRGQRVLDRCYKNMHPVAINKIKTMGGWNYYINELLRSDIELIEWTKWPITYANIFTNILNTD